MLALLQRDPRHPGLNLHPYRSYRNPFDPQQTVWESYVQNRTASAYRVFWCYRPNKGQIKHLTIMLHS